MQVTTIRVRRAAKINTGNYENTDISYEFEAAVSVDEDLSAAVLNLTSKCDEALRNKIDEVELGTRKVQSKAKRFGV